MNGDGTYIIEGIMKLRNYWQRLKVSTFYHLHEKHKCNISDIDKLVNK